MPDHLITRTTFGRPKKHGKRAKPRGITNKQARFLADLQRQAGLKYTGRGMTRHQATKEIERLVDQREEVRARHRGLDRRWTEKADAA